jgi:hypothetical protein
MRPDGKFHTGQRFFFEKNAYFIRKTLPSRITSKPDDEK